MAVLGLDLSLTSTGMVVLSSKGKIIFNGTAGYGLKKGTITDEIKRLEDIVCAVEEVLGEYPVKYAVIEDYAYNQIKKGVTMITKQAELTGPVKMICRQYNKEVIVVTASQARKLTFERPVGTTSAERKQGITVKMKIAKMVKTDFDLEFKTEDEADAFVLAEAVRRISGGAGPLSPEQIMSLRKIEKRAKGGKKRGK